MKTYQITFSPLAKEGLAKLKRSEPTCFQKAMRLLNEIVVHPKTGTGHPEPLKGIPTNRWSRQISKKHRLVYRIFEAEIHVDVLSSYGHYEDK
ncbi:MAG: Txe/YoeB family addiction module toxin [Prevotella sp.]|nr:Txe/YoeB family addiction module toxin [Prevotella sp.]MBR1463361.1 Txe/YoeB family addiction module toxin [Prevotella sp.]